MQFLNKKFFNPHTPLMHVLAGFRLILGLNRSGHFVLVFKMSYECSWDRAGFNSAKILRVWNEFWWRGMQFDFCSSSLLNVHWYEISKMLFILNTSWGDICTICVRFVLENQRFLSGNLQTRVSVVDICTNSSGYLTTVLRKMDGLRRLLTAWLFVRQVVLIYTYFCGTPNVYKPLQ